MIVRHIRPQDVGPYIQKMQKGMDSDTRKKMHRMVIGPTMLTMAIVSFATATGPDDKQWRSGAAQTKLGGRFSLKYNKRPSGRVVGADSLRNLDTGALANGHVVIEANASRVKVGPGTRGKSGKARVIMEREAGYGNHAVGWDRKRIQIVRAELQAFFDDIAMGREPRYLPRSRIRTRI